MPRVEKARCGTCRWYLTPQCKCMLDDTARKDTDGCWLWKRQRPPSTIAVAPPGVWQRTAARGKQ
jgi:hypothetical protein